MEEGGREWRREGGKEEKGGREGRGRKGREKERGREGGEIKVWRSGKVKTTHFPLKYAM